MYDPGQRPKAGREPFGFAQVRRWATREYSSAAKAGGFFERLNRSGKPLRHPKAPCSSLEILIFLENWGRAERSQLFERPQGTAPLKHNPLEWAIRRTSLSRTVERERP